MGRINVTSLIFAEPCAPTIHHPTSSNLPLMASPGSSSVSLAAAASHCLRSALRFPMPPHIAICTAAPELPLEPHCSPFFAVLHGAELFLVCLKLFCVLFRSTAAKTFDLYPCGRGNSATSDA